MATHNSSVMTPRLKGKPQLPDEIKQQLPRELVHLISSYVPPYEKPKPPSPGLQSALRKIQLKPLKGTSPNYMTTLEDYLWEDDFVLDR
jgi:hypothetical protein